MLNGSSPTPPRDARRVFLRELLGAGNIADEKREVIIPTETQISNNNNNNNNNVMSKVPLELSPRAIFTTKENVNGIKGLPRCTPLTRDQLIINNNNNNNNNNGQTSPIFRSDNIIPPRTSPVISNSIKDLRRRRFNIPTSSLSDNVATSNPSIIPTLPTTPVQSLTRVSSRLSSSSSSAVLQGAGGGRRIFKRVGMNCIYDIYGDDSVNLEENSIETSEKTNKLKKIPIESGGSNVPFVRPWIRQQMLTSINSCNGIRDEAFSPISQKSKEINSISKASTKENKIKNKIQNPNFTGTHRGKHNCPRHRFVNEGDLHVADLPHKDSSHYIRSYNLSRTLDNEDNNNNNNESEQNTNRRNSADMTSENSVITALTAKSSIALSSTLSNIRAKSKNMNDESLLLSPRESFNESITNEIKPQTTIPKIKELTKGNRIIEEHWCGSIDSNSSRSSSISSTKSNIQDDESCCSCCSCFIENNSNSFAEAFNGMKIEQNSEPKKSISTVPLVTYNNFFDDCEIPTLSMHSFRRSSDLGSRLSQE